MADLQIRSLFDNQQFADPLGLEAQVGISAATWPLFGLLWPSGAELVAHMALRPFTVGERILEMGCGLGLASLVGHRRGADMTASDCHPLAAQFLAEKPEAQCAVAHEIPPWAVGNCRCGRCPRNPALAPRAAATSNEPSTRNDGSVAVSGRFDLIMGSDILYERDDTCSLAQFIEEHAAASAEVWIVDPNRGNRPAFNRRMSHMGFALTEVRLDHLANPTQGACKGRLLTYLRHKPDIA